MFSAQRILITIDGFHFSITEEAAKYLPSCDALTESRVYMTNYSELVTEIMITPILEELHNGFTGKYINHKAQYWDYHRLFLHKYISHDVTSRLLYHPRRIDIQKILGTTSNEFLCDKFNQRYLASHNLSLSLRTYDIYGTKQNFDVHDFSIHNPGIRKFVDIIMGNIHEEYIQSIITPELLMDREIFGL